MTDWNIQSRAHACQQCGQGFTNGAPYHTVLFEEGSDHVRRDVCVACWSQRDTDGDSTPRRYLSHWQGVYELPPPPSELIRKETAETLLRKLVELEDPRYEGPVFILAVMLERKRLLKVKDQIAGDGPKTIIYERARTGEVIAVTDPQLSVDQLEQVQRDVSRLLERGIENGPERALEDAPEPVLDPTDAARAQGDQLEP